MAFPDGYSLPIGPARHSFAQFLHSFDERSFAEFSVNERTQFSFETARQALFVTFPASSLSETELIASLQRHTSLLALFVHV